MAEKLSGQDIRDTNEWCRLVKLHFIQYGKRNARKHRRDQMKLVTSLLWYAYIVHFMSCWERQIYVIYL